MTDVVFYIALIWMTVLLLATMVLVIRAPTVMTRILALDTVSLVLVALLVLYSTTTESWFYIDAAILLALVSFLSAFAASRYYSEGRIFQD